MKSILGGNAIEMRFRAEDREMAFHEELTLITHDLLEDQLSLYTISTNTPGMLQHQLAEDCSDEVRERRLVFRLGDFGDLGGFRQEVTLDLLLDGTLEYRYGWGVPHERFAIRNRAVLRPHSD